MIPYEDEFLEAVEAAIFPMNMHAREGAPEEVVGMVMSDGSVVRLVNQAHATNRFSVSRTQLAEKLAQVDPEIHTVVAIYHSHPSGTTTLSPEDQKSMRSSWTMDGLTLPWVTIVPDSRMAIWWLDPKYQVPRSHLIRMEEGAFDG